MRHALLGAVRRDGDLVLCDRLHLGLERRTVIPEGPCAKCLRHVHNVSVVQRGQVGRFLGAGHKTFSSNILRDGVRLGAIHAPLTVSGVPKPGNR